MKRRSEDLIVSQILDICESGAGKTKIVYQANLNSLRVNHYLDTLVNNGLIDKVSQGSRTFYKTTPKGMVLREKFERLQSEMEELHDIIMDTSA
jgi:predicted transcriptional regulator